jgi:hypothetical protein
MSAIRLVMIVATAMLAVTPLRVEAHHSAVMFDDQKNVTFEGVVKEFQYTNPHSWLLGGCHQQGRLGHHVGL